MSNAQKVKADTVALEVRVIGGKGNPKLKLKVANEGGTDVDDAGLDAYPAEPGRDLVIGAVPDSKSSSRIDRLYGCHACGDPDNLTLWTSGATTQATILRGAAVARNGYFTVIARLEDGTFASADPPITVRPIIPPPPPIKVSG
jgi:hypothetical protein